MKSKSYRLINYSKEFFLMAAVAAFMHILIKLKINFAKLQGFFSFYVLYNKGSASYFNMKVLSKGRWGESLVSKEYRK